MKGEDRGSNVGMVLISFLAGVSIGSGLALLFTPKSEREMRTQIKDLTDDAISKTREYATDAQEKIKSTYKEGKERVKEKQAIISSAIEAGKEAMERERERLS